MSREDLERALETRKEEEEGEGREKQRRPFEEERREEVGGVVLGEERVRSRHVAREES